MLPTRNLLLPDSPGQDRPDRDEDERLDYEAACCPACGHIEGSHQQCNAAIAAGVD